ncbi:AMP-binding protein [Exiguobacterium antarcticum]|uniref:AMP-binding protein n=1 Tax=Exiguobacterium antarcticum TaxID=132920 RepID=A0ABT6R3N8_9BACL|nr:AMP-binding protein [Exiguobacterium antarcticum]MDI3235550.1 AMP-binding protein [Exiguobacterium antarcticum]
MDSVWLKDYPEQVPASIDYREVPLYQALEEAADDFPERRALSFLGKRMTFQEVRQEARRFAHVLQEAGLEKGDRVGLMLPNCPQYMISYYAVLYAGGTVVQVNPLYTDRELEQILVDSGAKILVTLDLLYPKASRVKAVTALQTVVTTSIADYLPFPKNKLYPIKSRKDNNIIIDTTGSIPFLSHRGHESIEPVEINPKEDIAVLQYTGGTTGAPKGVMLTHFNLSANVEQISRWFYKYSRGDGRKLLAVVPYFHVYGMTCNLNFGMFNAYEQIILPKFDIEQVLKAIDKEKPNLFPGAPTMYVGLLNHPKLKKYDLSSIEACISGSAPLPVEVQEKFEQVTGGRIVEGYGLSETSPVTHTNCIWDKRVPGTVGIPVPDTIAKIVQGDGETAAAPGEIGEILVRGPQVMKGYWKRPEDTQAVLRDGWLHTGDLGYVGEDHYFRIVDRKKDLIIASGFNIYPREVEEILYEHPAVKEAVVIGVPDAYRGETVKAFIVLKDDGTVTEEELDQFCRKSLASFKVPKQYEFRQELPKTFVGKILRRVLIEEERAKQLEERS